MHQDNSIFCCVNMQRCHHWITDWLRRAPCLLNDSTQSRHSALKSTDTCTSFTNNNAFQSPTPHCSCDLDLDPMTLIYKRDLDISKMYLRPKRSFYVKAVKSYSPNKTDRLTDATERI